MIKDVLQSIEGIEIYPIVSLLLFFLTYLFAVYKTMRLDKNFRDKMKKLPLEKEQTNKEMRR